MTQTTYRFGSVEIDPAQRLIRVAGEAVYPRSRTFDLLLYLIEHRGRIVPRQELRDLLWPGVVVTDNSVVQCVNEARKALQDDARDPRFIRTTSKAGYQFIGALDASVPAASPEPTPPPLPAPPPQTTRKTGRIVAAGAVAAVALLAIGIHRYTQADPEPPWWEAAWWTFDEGHGTRATDSVASLAASLPAGVSWRPGVFGSSLLFHSREVALEGKDPGGVLPRGDAPRTLIATIRTVSPAGDDTILFQSGDGDFDIADHFYIGLHQTGVALFGNRNILIGKTRIDDGRWHQVAGVFEGGPAGPMRLFVDGIEEAAGPPAGPVQAGRERHWSIGRRFHGGTTFRGAIDDVRVFVRALRPAEVMALNRCQSGCVDLDIEGQGYYFSPVNSHNVTLVSGEDGEKSTRIRNTGLDYSGVTFVSAKPNCPLASVRGADVGQDLRIQADFRFADLPSGKVAEAGPYFRSRGAAPSDGLFGGVSAGFWVQLISTGQVRVMRLNPMTAVAMSKGPVAGGWDPRAWHALAAEVRGEQLEVTLDGKVVEYEDGARSLRLEPKWENLDPAGRNRGSAGIAFGASRNRGFAGGQEARNIRVVRHPVAATTGDTASGAR